MESFWNFCLRTSALLSSFCRFLTCSLSDPTPWPASRLAEAEYRTVATIIRARCFLILPPSSRWTRSVDLTCRARRQRDKPPLAHLTDNAFARQAGFRAQPAVLDPINPTVDGFRSASCLDLGPELKF